MTKAQFINSMNADLEEIMPTQPVDTHELAQFKSLICQLSPENLSQDGELSPRKVAARRKELMKQWAQLEKKIGRRVTDDEVWVYLANNPR